MEPRGKGDGSVFRWKIDPSPFPEHFTVVHALRRRLRLLTPVVYKDRERAYLLEILLTRHPGIARVRAVPDIGSVAVHYDPARVTEERLLVVLERVLGNLAARPGQRPVRAAPPAIC